MPKRSRPLARGAVNKRDIPAPKQGTFMQAAPRPPALQPVETTAAPPVPATTRERLRSRLLIGAAALVLTAGAAYGGRWFLVGRYLESTDNAYLQADNAVVAPKVAGYIT